MFLTKKVIESKNMIIRSINSPVIIYKFIDTIADEEQAVNYLIEFLNSIDIPGLPPNVLKLKIGIPAILLRNIYP